MNTSSLACEGRVRLKDIGVCAVLRSNTVNCSSLKSASFKENRYFHGDIIL